MQSYRYEKTCKIDNCYYCRRGYCFNNGFKEGYYCEICYIPEDICKICDTEDDLIWECDVCEDKYCFTCKSPFVTQAECPIENCYYCRKNKCHNNYVTGTYCLYCIDEIIKEDEDKAKLIINECLENKDYKKIKEVWGITMEYMNRRKTDECCICLDKQIECETECGHGYCLNCLMHSKYVYDNMNCALCNMQLNNKVMVYR